MYSGRDLSWSNEAPVFYDTFNLKQNNTYEVTAAIAVLVNSSIAIPVFQSNILNFSEYIHPHVYMQYQNSNHVQLLN